MRHREEKASGKAYSVRLQGGGRRDLTLEQVGAGPWPTAVGFQRWFTAHGDPEAGACRPKGCGKFKFGPAQ